MSRAERNVDGTDIRILTNHKAVIVVTDTRDDYLATVFTSAADITWLIGALMEARATAFSFPRTKEKW